VIDEDQMLVLCWLTIARELGVGCDLLACRTDGFEEERNDPPSFC
jgi:hypothetical protein